MRNNICEEGKVTLIAGPCSVESKEQMQAMCDCIKELGLSWVRGGAYKPRTSPHMFQGLGAKAIDILAEVSREYGLKSVSEVLDEDSLTFTIDKIDALQIGARNMTNFSFLKMCGKATKTNNMPILFKRGMSAKISEWLCATDYISEEGNNNIVLCERGVRTFEDSTRFTLDISAVPVIKKQSKYPICVDVSHATGASDLVPSMAKAAVAAGADAVMVEVHPNPSAAKSDGAQQLNLDEFKQLTQELKALTKAMGKELI